MCSLLLSVCFATLHWEDGLRAFSYDLRRLNESLMAVLRTMKVNQTCINFISSDATVRMKSLLRCDEAGDLGDSCENSRACYTCMDLSDV